MTMKKLLLTAIAVFAFSFANAQESAESSAEGFSKGDVMLSGSINFGTRSQGDIKNNGFEISPKVGYFITDHIVGGISLGYASAKSEAGPLNPTQKINTLSYGVFGRYYTTPAKQFSFFGEINANAFSSKNKTTNDFPNPSLENKMTGFQVGISPGISYFVSKHLALETSIGLLQYSNENPDGTADSRNSFDVGLNLSNINLGLVYKF
jgi:hypothetical protein